MKSNIVLSQENCFSGVGRCTLSLGTLKLQLELQGGRAQRMQIELKKKTEIKKLAEVRGGVKNELKPHRAIRTD